MFRSRMFVPTLILAALTIVAPAAEPPKAVKESKTVVRTAVIEAIDHAERVVTLKYADGEVETVFATPEMARFDALKVGDKVTFTFEESMVYQIAKPGDAPKAPESRSITASPGAKPGVTSKRELTTTVTVVALDREVPSVTVRNTDGSVKTFTVKDKTNLAGVKVGDTIAITFTQALMISVE